MTREQFEDVYKDTSSKQLRDMLYATIEKYENMSCEGCKWQHETGGRDYHSGVCENCFRELRDRYERKEDD